MRDEREFWIRIRRGLSIVTHAIDADRQRDPIWAAMLKGLNTVVWAIEVRWKLPHSSIHTIGQSPEPPVSPLARSSDEGIGHTDAV